MGRGSGRSDQESVTMMNKPVTLIVLGSWFVASLAAVASADPATGIVLNSPFAAADWTVTDIQGRPHQPWADPQTRAVVLVFISPDCPVSNYYQPTLRRLVDQYREAGVAWYFVHPLPQVTAEKARQHARDYAIPVPVVLDPRQALTGACGAKKMPQAAVIDRRGAIAYLGRIDDTFVGFGKRRAQPTEHNLRDAIAAVLAGEAVALPRTDSVGCLIPLAPGAGATRTGG
jgi:hypothetical protein